MLLSTIAYLLLPVAVLAAPAPVTEISPNEMAIREAAGVGITAAQIGCKIVSNGPVNCRSSPSLSARVVAKVYNGRWYNFYCWSEGSDVEGNRTWDWNGDLGCWVSGYYTDNHCTTAPYLEDVLGGYGWGGGQSSS